MNKNIVIIGASAGGPRILKQIFIDLPRLEASIIIIQHMPKFVNNSLVETLGRYSKFDVKIAEDGDILTSGLAYVAPSEVHLKLVDNRKIRLYQGEKVKFVCPSIDVAMLSIEKSSSGKIVGIILTGMGNDGAEGLCHIKRIDGTTIAQNKETSTIFGMPNEAIKTSMVDFVLPPEQIKIAMKKLVGFYNHSMA